MEDEDEVAYDERWGGEVEDSEVVSRWCPECCCVGGGEVWLTTHIPSPSSDIEVQGWWHFSVIVECETRYSMSDTIWEEGLPEKKDKALIYYILVSVKYMSFNYYFSLKYVWTIYNLNY